MNKYNFTNALMFQDFDKIFEAVECEELFETLKLDTPEDEVEYARKHAPVEEVRYM